MRRIAVLLGIAGMMALSLPASGAPTEPFSFDYEFDCGGTFTVLGAYEEWSQEKTLDNQVVLLVHATRTYTVDGESRPFFRFVSSFVDRNYVNHSGETNDFRAGLDEGFIGHTSFNYSTGEEAIHGQETLSPDDQACGLLTG